MRKKVLSLIVLVIILSTSICAFCVSCGTVREPEHASFTIMSYNMRYNGDSGKLSASSRLPRIIARIKEYSPDIVGGQEAQPVHIDRLKEALSDEYDLVFCYRDHLSFKNLSPESCPIFYKKDKFDLLDFGHFWLSETPDVESRMPGAGHNRICTWVKLREKESSREFYYYNVHLDFGEAQTKSLPVLLSRLAGDAPVILGGDLNTDPTEDNYAALCAELTDSRVVVGTDTDIGTYHDYNPPSVYLTRHIDYLMYRGVIRPVTHKVICDDEERWGKGNFASDHYPVLVTFILQKTE